MTRMILRATKELDFCITVDVPDEQVDQYLYPDSDDVIGEELEGLIPLCESWVDARAEVLEDASQVPPVMSEQSELPTLSISLEGGKLSGILANQPVRILLSDGDREAAVLPDEVISEDACQKNFIARVDPQSVANDLESYMTALRNRRALEDVIMQLPDAVLSELAKGEITKGKLARWENSRIDDPAVVGEVRLALLHSARTLCTHQPRAWGEAWQVMTDEVVAS